MRFTGRLEQLTVEGGVWLLVTDDGRRLQLVPPPKDASAGARVEVEGEVDSAGVSFQMAAPILRVRSLRRSDGR